MVRILSIVFVTLFLGQATGLSEIPGADACRQPCPGELPDGHCPPECQLCTCCATTKPVVLPQLYASLQQRSIRAVPGEQTRTPLPPEPRKIMHVPKPSLA